jgi:hypothetical protein
LGFGQRAQGVKTAAPGRSGDGWGGEASEPAYSAAAVCTVPVSALPPVSPPPLVREWARPERRKGGGWLAGD